LYKKCKWYHVLTILILLEHYQCSWSAAVINKIKLFLFSTKSTHEKFNGTWAEPTLNAVVSHGNLPETLMRECSPEIEETLLHFETSFWSIPCGLHKIFFLIFTREVETWLKRAIDMC